MITDILESLTRLPGWVDAPMVALDCGEDVALVRDVLVALADVGLVGTDGTYYRATGWKRDRLRALAGDVGFVESVRTLAAFLAAETTKARRLPGGDSRTVPRW